MNGNLQGALAALSKVSQRPDLQPNTAEFYNARAAAEDERQRLESTRENSGRLARASLFYDTTGTGELVVETPVQFGLAFVEQPVCMTGVVITGGIIKKKMPTVTAGVWKWQVDQKGFYIGAYLFFVVDSVGQPYSLRHSFVFEAEAIKLLAATVLAESGVNG